MNFPHGQTVYWYFNRWEQQKVTEKTLPIIRGQLRAAEGRDAEPSAGIIDSQSFKRADTVEQVTRGYDAGKKVNGRKRFIATDTLGLLLTVMVCSASVQDRDGAKSILLDLYLRTPRAVRLRRRRVRRPTARVDADDPADHSRSRPQTCRPARLLRPPTVVGGRTDPRLDHRTRPPGPRLRTPPRHLRGYDPLGRDQHHYPPHRPRSTLHPTAEARIHTRHLFFSNTLSDPGRRRRTRLYDVLDLAKLTVLVTDHDVETAELLRPWWHDPPSLGSG
ncbi:transposase [Amycolatopsis sp. NPDC049868]|uniref:transposase n=1 Tax=Amycolatopsis sp. NPDC049868 TaxID=3363934 RepID=UPI0037893E1D